MENLARPRDKNRRKLALEKTAKVTLLKTTHLGQCHRHHGHQPYCCHLTLLKKHALIPRVGCVPSRPPVQAQYLLCKSTAAAPAQTKGGVRVQRRALSNPSRKQEKADLKKHWRLGSTMSRRHHSFQTHLTPGTQMGKSVLLNGNNLGERKAIGQYIHINYAKSGKTTYKGKCRRCSSSEQWTQLFQAYFVLDKARSCHY